jgi:hypothetical protein
MPTPIRAAGHVVQIEHPLDLKRNMLPAFQKRQVPARIRHLRQINDATLA